MDDRFHRDDEGGFVFHHINKKYALKSLICL